MSLFGDFLNAGEATFSNLTHPTNLKPFTTGEMAYLQSGGVIYHFGWTWRIKGGGEKSIRVGPCFDADEGEREFIETLHEIGYRLPKWWEMSRWGEKRLSKDRREAIAALEAKASP